MTSSRLVPVTDSARIVVLAAGSLGSTDLLLRCRDVARTLPDLPATRAAQVSGTDAPRGLMVPAPVTSARVWVAPD